MSEVRCDTMTDRRRADARLIFTYYHISILYAAAELFCRFWVMGHRVLCPSHYYSVEDVRREVLSYASDVMHA